MVIVLDNYTLSPYTSMKEQHKRLQMLPQCSTSMCLQKNIFYMRKEWI